MSIWKIKFYDGNEVGYLHMIYSSEEKMKQKLNRMKENGWKILGRWKVKYM